MAQKIPLVFWHTNGSPNLGQTPDLMIIHNRNWTCRIVDFAVPADHTMKLRECEKKDKYLDLTRELKNCGTILPIVIGGLGTVTEGAVKGLKDFEIRGRVETIQTTALLRTARLLRRVVETWGDLLSFKLQEMTISKRWCEKLSWINNSWIT